MPEKFEGGIPLQEGIKIDEKINMDKARELGLTLFKGTNWEDLDEVPSSLEEMAKMEAFSRKEAKRRSLQTGVDVTRGVWVSWNDPESSIARRYEKLVQEYLAE